MNERLSVERRRILACIEQDEAALHEAMNDLGSMAHERLHPWRHAAEHPYSYLVGGLLIGVFLALRRD